MKLLTIVISILAVVTVAQADDSKQKPNVQERKAKILSNIDQRIELLNEMKACVTKANAQGDIKGCRMAHKEKAKALRPRKGKGKN